MWMRGHVTLVNDCYERREISGCPEILILCNRAKAFSVVVHKSQCGLRALEGQRGWRLL